MGDAFSFFLFILILLAVLTRETFVMVLLYLFVGAMFLGRWWTARVVNGLNFMRKYDKKAFPGEIIPVRVDVRNSSVLPAVWLRVQDFYPIELAETSSFAQVISLGPREQTSLKYNLKAHKRGFYTIGPLHVTSGDLLGMSGERMSEGATEHLTVYPRVIALSDVRLPSNSPMGTMRHKQPIFEDPTRPMGKRDYQSGDSLRRIDWKASATTGRLQTKLFEPSIALETAIFLNLNLLDYNVRTRFDATELAIVVTASVASWVVAQRQSTGLVAHGLDPLSADSRPVPVPSRKGRAHLMRILEILARIRAVEIEPFPAMLRNHRVHLPWGTTMIVVTGSAEQPLFDELLQSRRAGLNPVLLLCGEHPNHRQAAQQAKLFRIPVHVFRSEKDLDIWRT
ncbi:MAG: DUF58 domain-containing protein [Chloroflexi bacterium]|nr:MAG: DUF58 domain-containing protein [Chloroflexota bacterium]